MTTHFDDSTKSPVANDKLLADWDPDKFDPIKLSASIATAGYAWAEADGAAKVKDSVQDKLKSKIILEYLAGRRVDSYAETKSAEVKTKAMSTERAKLLVEQDEEYLEAVKDDIDARTHANKLRVRYDMARAMLDGLRSKEATHRALTTMR